MRSRSSESPSRSHTSYPAGSSMKLAFPFIDVRSFTCSYNLQSFWFFMSFYDLLQSLFFLPFQSSLLLNQLLSKLTPCCRLTSPRMWLNLSALIRRLSHEPFVRAIIFTGAGDRAFTAGLDVQAASQGTLTQPAASDPARKAVSLKRHILEFQACISELEKCEKRESVFISIRIYTFCVAFD